MICLRPGKKVFLPGQVYVSHVAVFLLFRHLGKIFTRLLSLLFAVVSIVAVVALSAVVPSKWWVAFASESVQKVGPIFSIVRFMEILIMAIPLTPFTNFQFMACSSICVATARQIEAFGGGTARFVSQASKVYTCFRKLPLSPR